MSEAAVEGFAALLEMEDGDVRLGAFVTYFEELSHHCRVVVPASR